MFNSNYHTSPPSQIPKGNDSGRLRKWRWQMLSSILVTVLAVSLGFNIYQRFNVSPNLGGQMNFSLTWGPESQDIVDGVFRIDITIWFENITSWDNSTVETFTILIKVADDDYNGDDYLGLVFDINHDGKINDPGDKPNMLYADNSTMIRAALMDDGSLGPYETPREKIYTCTFTPEEGYRFGPFRFPKGEVLNKIGDGFAHIPMHVCFEDNNVSFPGIGLVSFGFWVYSDETIIPEKPSYRVQITSVNASNVGEGITIGGRIDPPIEFEHIQISVRSPSYWTSGEAITDHDGSFRKAGWFYAEEPGTYIIFAELNNSTSNVVQIYIQEG